MQNRRISSETVIDDDGPVAGDAELGIGDADHHDAADASLKLLLQHPQIAALIDAAVQQRLGQLGHASGTDAGLAAVVAGIERLTTMHAAQMPGYSKPLLAEEIERRATGFTDMNGMLDRLRAEKTPPRYRLVNEPLFAGEIEYRPGSEIETYLYPNEHMTPLNEAARQVHGAMMRWIGGPQMGIAERVEEAERERRALGQFDQTPFRPAGLPDQAPVQMVADPPDTRSFDPRRPPQTAHDAAMSGIVHRV